MLGAELAWFLSQYVFPQVDVGPFPVRFLSTSVLGALAIGFSRFGSRVDKRARLCLFAWSVFLAFALVASLLNGNMLLTESTSLRSLASKFGVSTVVFMYLAFVPRTIRHFRYQLAFLLFWALLNSVTAWGQFLGSDGAIAVQHLTQVENEEPISLARPSGISATTVGCSYVTLCFGIAGSACWVDVRTSRRVGWRAFARLLIALFLFVICQAAAVPLLSRSSMVIGSGCSMAIGLVLMRSVVSGGVQPILALLIVVAAAGAAAQGLSEAVSQSQLGTSAYRLGDLQDADRWSLVQAALLAIEERPWFGGLQHAMRGPLQHGNTPHNMLLNAAVYYGIPACMALVQFIVCVATCSLRALSNGLSGPIGLMRSLVAVALLAYIGKGLVHNDGFGTGGIMGMMLLGMMLTPIKLASSPGRGVGRCTTS